MIMLHLLHTHSIIPTQHPLGQLLYEETLAQHRAYGNGVTTVVCMAAFWTREIRQMMAEVVYLPSHATPC